MVRYLRSSAAGSRGRVKAKALDAWASTASFITDDGVVYLLGKGSADSARDKREHKFTEDASVLAKSGNQRRHEKIEREGIVKNPVVAKGEEVQQIAKGGTTDKRKGHAIEELHAIA